VRLVGLEDQQAVIAPFEATPRIGGTIYALYAAKWRASRQDRSPQIPRLDRSRINKTDRNP
jgi:hypothetical protein